MYTEHQREADYAADEMEAMEVCIKSWGKDMERMQRQFPHLDFSNFAGQLDDAFSDLFSRYWKLQAWKAGSYDDLPKIKGLVKLSKTYGEKLLEAINKSGAL